MRREDLDTAPDGYKPVFENLSIRWGLIVGNDQIAIKFDLPKRWLDVLHSDHSGVTEVIAETQFFGGRNFGKVSSKTIKIVQDALQQIRT